MIRGAKLNRDVLRTGSHRSGRSSTRIKRDAGIACHCARAAAIRWKFGLNQHQLAWCSGRLRISWTLASMIR